MFIIQIHLLSIIYYIVSFINAINASVQINVDKEETLSGIIVIFDLHTVSVWMELSVI